MKIIMKIFVAGICAVGVLMAGVALAQIPPTRAAHFAGDELSLFEEIPVVYSASKMEESILDAPAAISVITDEELERWGIIDVPDAFRRVPGMDVMAIDGRTWGVSARGFNERWSRRMLVLMDGMSVYTPLFSGVNWDFLPLLVDDIKDIEVVRGPNDTLYGFNAFNGVININTKEPEEAQGFFGKYIYGDYAETQFIGRYGDTLDFGDAGKLGFRVAYSYNTERGYGDNFGRGFSDSRQVQMVTSRAKYELSDNLNAEFIFGINYGPRDIAPVLSNVNSAVQFTEMDFEIAKINCDFSGTHKAYLQFYRWGVNRDVKRLTNNLPANDYRERQYDIEFQDSFSLFDGKSHTVVGVSYRHNTVESLLVKRELPGNVRQQAHDDLWSAFINEKLILLEDKPLIDSLTVVAGVRAEWSHLTRSTEFAPRASLLYSPVENNILRFTYARGYRLPNFIEEFNTNLIPSNTGAIVQVLGNQDIKPETVDSIEFGYSGMFLDGKLEANADTFLAYYNGLIQTFQGQPRSFFPAAPQIINYNNNSKAQSVGVELAGAYKPVTWLNIYGNYTYEQIKDTLGSNANTSIYKGATPDNKFNIGFDLVFKEDSIENMSYLDGLEFNLNANFRDNYIFFNEDSPRSEFDIKKHWRLDLRVGKSFFKDSVEVAFIGQNLLGSGNYDARFVKVPQQLYLTVTLRGWPWKMMDEAKKEENIGD